jgi:hypothetical protein
MNEHDEYLCDRDDTYRTVAWRWMIAGLVVFWTSIILITRACA